jgi:hypothetical protein
MRLLPRLPPSTSRQLADEYAAIATEQLRSLSKPSHPAAYFASSGGNRISESDLLALRDRMHMLLSDATSGGAAATRRFDTLAARVIHQMLLISPSEAAHPGGWAFLGCVLLPHVVRWRFPGQSGEPTSTERFLGSQRGLRNCFGRLWWRAELLVDHDAEDPYHLITELGEDELVQITERPSLAGYRPLARLVGLAIAGLPSGEGAQRTQLARDFTRRVRRAAALVEVRALSEDALTDLVRKSLGAPAGQRILSRLAAETPGPYFPNPTTVDSEISEEPELVVSKRLSPNDLGRTGSHQAAIVIAPAQAREVASLDENLVNPEVQVKVRSADHPRTWTWRLIHYNGRRHGTTTRDEYRLTGVIPWIDWARPDVGDVLELYRVDAHTYEVRTRSDA